MIRLMLCLNSFGKFVFTFIDHYIIHIPISTGTLWKCSTPSPPSCPLQLVFILVMWLEKKEIITQREYPSGFVFFLAGWPTWPVCKVPWEHAILSRIRLLQSICCWFSHSQILVPILMQSIWLRKHCVFNSLFVWITSLPSVKLMNLDWCCVVKLSWGCYLFPFV